MNTDESGLNTITELIIRSAFTVSNTLGCGFLEKVYENALAPEIRKHGLDVLQQHGISVYYEGLLVGEYYADLVVGKNVLVELKAVKSIDEIHFAQCLNYLKATGLRMCLLLNLGTLKVEIKRIIR